MNEKKYAILIANCDFPKEPKLLPLACPINDIQGLHEILSSPKYGDFTEVHMLKNEPHYEALRTINIVLKKAEKNDFVLIYYSGHGKLDQAGRLYLATNNTEAPLLEATSIPVDNIRSILDVSRTSKSALILDCCYSGAVEKAFLRGNVDEQLNVMSRGKGTFIMTSATGIETAKEKEDEGFGVFTKHIIEGISSGDADRDGDGVVTMNEIYNYVHDKVIEESHQEPMRWGLNLRGELVLAKSGKGSRDDRRQQIRTVLLEMANKELLPDWILTKALSIIGLQRKELNDELRQYDLLLDELTGETLTPGRFVEGWHALDLKYTASRSQKVEGKKDVDDGRSTVTEEKSEETKEKISQENRQQREDVTTGQLGTSSIGQEIAGNKKISIFKKIFLWALLWALFYCLPAFALLVYVASIVVQHYYVSSYGYRHYYISGEGLILGFGIFFPILAIMVSPLRRLSKIQKGKNKKLWFHERYLVERMSIPKAKKFLWLGLVLFLAITVIGFFVVAERAL